MRRMEKKNTACLNCRELKKKCDGDERLHANGKTIWCSKCLDRGIPCIFPWQELTVQTTIPPTPLKQSLVEKEINDMRLLVAHLTKVNGRLEKENDRLKREYDELKVMSMELFQLQQETLLTQTQLHIPFLLPTLSSTVP